MTVNLTIFFSLSAAISNPELDYRLLRNPRYKNAGNFIKLSDFLAYAKGQALSGILIDIEVRTNTHTHTYIGMV